jgi:CheY-like chemotaxis protein
MKKRILFAEDEKALQMIYREELEEEGYEVCFADNGQEALTSFLEGKFDLVILDIRMPVMDPRSLLADGFIRKTTDLNELKAKIKELFGHINSK